MRNCFLFLILIFSVSCQQKIDVNTDGLIFYYKFDGNGEDSGLLGNDAILNNIEFSEDRYGSKNSALKLRKEKQGYIEVQNFLPLNSNAFTISVFVKKGETENNETLLGRFNDINIPSERGMGIAYCDPNFGGQLKIFNRNKLGFPNLQFSKDSVSVNFEKRWHHLIIAMTFGSGKKAKMYIDGNEIEVTMPLGDNKIPLLRDLQNRFLIGACQCNPIDGGAAQFFNGELDDFLYYNRELKEEEIMNLFEIFKNK